MNLSVEQIAEEALSLPSEARALLADRLVESLDPSEDGYIRQLWAAEACRRRDDVRAGRVKTIPGDEALKQVRQAFIRSPSRRITCSSSQSCTVTVNLGTGDTAFPDMSNRGAQAGTGSRERSRVLLFCFWVNGIGVAKSKT